MISENLFALLVFNLDHLLDSYCRHGILLQLIFVATVP